VINLAYFKGHAMGGFGGVIKNMSIGIVSSMGKSLIHSAGKETTGFSLDTPQDDFLKSMAEAAESVADYVGYNKPINNLVFDDHVIDISGRIDERKGLKLHLLSKKEIRESIKKGEIESNASELLSYYYEHQNR